MDSRLKPKRALCMADIMAGTLSSDDDMPVPPPMLPMRRARTDPITSRAQLGPRTTWQHAKRMFSDGATSSSDDDMPVPPPMLPMYRARTEPIAEDIQTNDDYQATRLQEDLSKQASDTSHKAAAIPQPTIVDRACMGA